MFTGKGGRGICQMSTLVNKGEGDQSLVNVDKFELFICLSNLEIGTDRCIYLGPLHLPGFENRMAD